MHTLTFLDCRIVSSADASILALSSASLYGQGVFTTIAIYSGKAFLWDKHWRRLESNADKLKIDLAEFSETITKAALAEIMEKNDVSNGRARITFFDESPTKICLFEADRQPRLLI